MKNVILTLCFVAVFGMLLVSPTIAQDRATMSAPVIRSSGDEIVFTVRFEGFAEGRSYRIGFGGKGEKAPNSQIELSVGDSKSTLESMDFVQGNTSGWWKIEELGAKGYTIEKSGIPAAGTALTFRVTVPRDVSDGYEKLYLFVSRDYGSGRWYLEDGSEIDKSDW